jgi:hypothetical protein
MFCHLAILVGDRSICVYGLNGFFGLNGLFGLNSLNGLNSLFGVNGLWRCPFIVTGDLYCAWMC